MTRPDEEYAKYQFDSYLSNKFSTIKFQWNKGDEPPDYYLTFDNEIYAVEVTQVNKKINTPRGIKPLNLIEASVRDLVKEIDKEAKNLDVLDGKYVIFFSDITRDFYAVRKQIKQRILSIIKSTQMDQNSRVSIEIDYTKYCEVMKIDNRENRVSLAYSSTSAELDSEISSELYNSIKEAVINKSYRLRNVNMPQILVLIIEYMDTNLQQCVAHIKNVDEAKNFHTIFLCGGWDSFKSGMAYSIKTEWL